jgi:hypothetical protein
MPSLKMLKLCIFVSVKAIELTSLHTSGIEFPLGSV